jgi:protein tyrosine phosphatase (PTP) superfamily phosphohydrolase (DUF442 family)
MASRLMALDASRGLVLVHCRCGFRAAALTQDAARAMADLHRAQDHPRQATYVMSKRRARAAAGTGA